MKYLVKYLHRSPLERFLLLLVVPLLLVVQLGLRLLPLQTLKRLLNQLAKVFPGGKQSGLSYPEQVVWAVTTASRRLFKDGSCLVQALVVELFFRRKDYPAELCIGITKEQGGKLVAHAWVESDGVIVIGGPESEVKRYSRLPALDGGLF